MGLERLEALPKECADALQCPGAIVIGVNAVGDIAIHFHGIDSHMQAVEKLAVAIHAVMGEHDKAVLAGAAGPGAQERFMGYHVNSALLTHSLSAARTLALNEWGWELISSRNVWRTRSGALAQMITDVGQLRGTDINYVAVHGDVGQEAMREIALRGSFLVEIDAL